MVRLLRPGNIKRSQRRVRCMRLALIPKGSGRYIILKRKIAAFFAPAQRLNGDPQLVFKADGVENMPAIEAKTLPTLEGRFRRNNLGQAQEQRGIGAIVTFWEDKAPGSPKIILGARSSNSWERIIPIQVKFDLTFSPPAWAVSLPGQVRANIVARSTNLI